MLDNGWLTATDLASLQFMYLDGGILSVDRRKIADAAGRKMASFLAEDFAHDAGGYTRNKERLVELGIEPWVALMRQHYKDNPRYLRRAMANPIWKARRSNDLS